MGTRMSRVKIESDLLSQLSQKTQFTEDDLRSWNIAFLSECPNGRLSQREFASIFRKLFPLPVPTDKDTSIPNRPPEQSQKSVEEIAFKSHGDLSQLLFRGFPTSPDNTTDFKGFATVLSIICRGTIEAKSDWLFSIIDSEGNERISHKNIVHAFTILISFIQSITGHQYENVHEIATQRANTVFTSLSKEQDAILSSEDFMNWIKQNEEVIEQLDIFLTKV